MAGVDPRITLLRNSVLAAPVVWKGEYPYFVHPLTDGVPRQSAELLVAARDLIIEMVDWNNVDVILGVEAMGLPLAATLSVAVNKPLVIARKRSYGMEGEVEVGQSTGYSKGTIFLNDLHEGDRVLVVDDVISTGGTMSAILSSIERIGATFPLVVILFEKGEGMQKLIEEHGWPMQSLVRLLMKGAEVVLLD